MTAQTIKILLAGGGTLGSVNPLLAVYEEAKKQGKNWQWLWVGTKNGPERALIQTLGIKYATLPTAKLRRYRSALNFFVPFVLLLAFLKSLILLLRIRPQVVITAGSFIGVPIVWAGCVYRKFIPSLPRACPELVSGFGAGFDTGGGFVDSGQRRKPSPLIIVHQQDIHPGLANKLCAPFADKITVAFEKSLADYPAGKVEWLGNPVREWIGQGSPDEARRLWPLDENYPAILIMGGSSGAQALNQWVWRHLPQLTEFANVIHLTGVGKGFFLSSLRRGKGVALEEPIPPYPPLTKGGTKGGLTNNRYIQLEFLDKDLTHALAAADLVVSRAGIATLSELSYLGKPAIVVPLADTHQEENADYFAARGAAVVFKQNELDKRLVEKIKSLLADGDKRVFLSKNIKKIMRIGAREKIVKLASSVIATPSEARGEQSNNRDKDSLFMNKVNRVVQIAAAARLAPRDGLPRNDTGKIHLIGIGGINVSAIAKLLLAQGKIVSGSDLVASDITCELQNMGTEVFIGHSKQNVAPDADLVVYSDAVPADNPERVVASERNIPQISNFQFWGEYARGKKVIAISGTNGKSTATAMLGLILEAAGFDPTVVVGTKILQWGSNIRIGKSEWLVIEADEYRAHMLEFQPYIAVITNITPDHLDYYRDLDDIVAHFQKWLKTIPPDGWLILNANDAASQKLRVGNVKVVIPTKSRVAGRVEESLIPRLAKYKGFLGFGRRRRPALGMTIINNLHLQVPGAFNIANALAAAGAAQILGIRDDIIVSALNNFTGTWRRFEKVGEYKGALVISDYAHHPDGIKVTLQAAREKYPERRLVVLYQPHQHNRTRKLFEQFVESFDAADELILAEIYDVPGREQAQDKSISSRDLVKAIKERLIKFPPAPGSPKTDERSEEFLGWRQGRVGGAGDVESRLSSDNIVYAPNLQSAEEMVKKIIQPNDVLLVMGAGDIDKVARNLCQT